MNAKAATSQQLQEIADNACISYYKADRAVREALVDATNIGHPEHLSALEDAKVARDAAMEAWKIADLAATGRAR